MKKMFDRIEVILRKQKKTFSKSLYLSQRSHLKKP